MLKVTDILEFTKCFTCEERCRIYLYQLKWKDGFSCFRCGCNISGRGHTALHLRCMNCNYEESITANTSLHKLKIPLSKAFGLIYRIVVPTRGSSSADLAREYNISRKTAWAFAQKVRRAMVLDDSELPAESIEVTKVIDSIIICGGKKEHSGLQQVNVSLSYRENPKALRKKTFSAKCRIPSEPSKTNCELLFGKFVKQNKDINLWNFKTWLTGSHHRCSLKYIQQYANEYFFRMHHRDQIETLWYKVLVNMIKTKPVSALGSGPK